MSFSSLLDTMTTFWTPGTWLNEPPAWETTDQTLTVTTGFETDFWRTTSYGFIHDTGHALLYDFPDKTSFECSFEADYSQQFDQAGVMVWAGEGHWVKCGVEYADGAFGIGAVVTSDVSDWSTAPHDAWAGSPVRLRVSRFGDALTIRAQTVGGSWELVRLAPIDSTKAWSAGPYAATPTREGLSVRFFSPVWGPAEQSLH